LKFNDPLVNLFKKEFRNILDILRDTELTSYNRAVLNSRLQEVGRVLINLDSSTKIWISHVYPKYWDATIKTAQDYFKYIEAPMKAYTFTGIHLETVRLAMEETYYDIARGLRYVDYSAKRIIQESAKEIIIQGKIKGITLTESKKILEKKIENIGVNAIIDKGGKRWSLDTYAEMVLRTKTMKLANDTMINYCIDNGRQYVVINPHDTECPFCAPWQGKVVSITMDYDPEIAEGTLDEVEGSGVFHPNCLCTYSPYVPELQEYKYRYRDELFDNLDKASDDTYKEIRNAS